MFWETPLGSLGIPTKNKRKYSNPPPRSSRPEVFCKKGVLKNLAKFTGKYLCHSLFFNKVADLSSATLFKRRLWHRCISVNFAKFLRTLIFIENLCRLLLTTYCHIEIELLQTTFLKSFHNHERSKVQVLLYNDYWTSSSTPELRDKQLLPKKDSRKISVKILGSQIQTTKEKIDQNQSESS